MLNLLDLILDSTVELEVAIANCLLFVKQETNKLEMKHLIE